jgi:hypothetical protein
VIQGASAAQAGLEKKTAATKTQSPRRIMFLHCRARGRDRPGEIAVTLAGNRNIGDVFQA